MKKKRKREIQFILDDPKNKKIKQKLFWDEIIYGKCIYHIKKDGTIVRIDPRYDPTELHL